MTIIGVCGKARVGKDTFGKYIAEEFKEKYNRTFELTAFAHVLKLMCQEHFGLSYEQLWGSEKEHMTGYWKPGKGPHSYNPADYWSPREIMQELGGFYRTIDYDFWVKRLYKEMEGVSDFIITDVRHVNEADSVKNHNGVLIKVNRGAAEQIHNMQHESETGLDNYPEENYDIIIENNTSLEDLRSSVSLIIPMVNTIERLQKEGGMYNG